MIIIYILIAVFVVLVILLIIFVKRIWFRNDDPHIGDIDYRYTERPFINKK
jgi:hypothetical protein